MPVSFLSTHFLAESSVTHKILHRARICSKDIKRTEGEKTKPLPKRKHGTDVSHSRTVDHWRQRRRTTDGTIASREHREPPCGKRPAPMGAAPPSPALGRRQRRTRASAGGRWPSGSPDPWRPFTCAELPSAHGRREAASPNSPDPEETRPAFSFCIRPLGEY